MKKIIAIIAALAVTSVASAADFTVGLGHNYGANSNTGTIAIGTQFDTVRGELSLGRTFTDARKANVIGISATYPLVSILGVGLAARAGFDYVDGVNFTRSGYAARAGVEGLYALDNNTALVATFERIDGERYINHNVDGNVFSLGVRSSF